MGVVTVHLITRHVTQLDYCPLCTPGYTCLPCEWYYRIKVPELMSEGGGKTSHKHCHLRGWCREVSRALGLDVMLRRPGRWGDSGLAIFTILFWNIFYLFLFIWLRHVLVAAWGIFSCCFLVHPYCGVYQNFIFFYGWIIVHYLCVPHFVYPFICWLTFGWFTPFGNCE